ncbi:MAG TPA: cyclopropane-fatty-acyl-phospholipid synthase family protein [Pseudolabrys sp.]
MADTGPMHTTPVGARERFGGRGILTGFVERLLQRIETGSLTVALPNGQRIIRRGTIPGPHARVVIRRWRAIWRLVAGGDLGLAEAYIDGDWWTPDLFAFLSFGALNEKPLQGSISGLALMRVLNRVKHWRRRNTRSGSRHNISAHYDIGNSFYTHWLDRGMSYSSALFPKPDMTLEEAQNAKLNRAVDLLDVAGGGNVLEIGCGWGALAECLVEKCHVTGITLSNEQLDFARDRLNKKNLAARASLRLQDYRDVGGQFDRIVSIEMLEAVGEAYWPAFFETLHDRLRPGGIAVLQAITIDERRFDSYRKTPDFIQKYIFPGGMLPTIRIMESDIARAGLKLVKTEFFGDSYVRTLAEWQRRFRSAWPSIQKLGFDERFKRMWDYYLSYCQAGFATGALNVGFYKITPAASL